MHPKNTNCQLALCIILSLVSVFGFVRKAQTDVSFSPPDQLLVHTGAPAFTKVFQISGLILDIECHFDFVPGQEDATAGDFLYRFVRLSNNSARYCGGLNVNPGGSNLGPWVWDVAPEDPLGEGYFQGTPQNGFFFSFSDSVRMECWMGNTSVVVPSQFNNLTVTLVGPVHLVYALEDLNQDNLVDGSDLGLLLGAWGTADPVADVNYDGMVDGSDLGLLLGAWTG
jgi:hypothetical protein